MNKLCGMGEAKMIIMTRSMLEPWYFWCVYITLVCLSQWRKSEDFLLIILIQFWDSQESVSHLFQGDFCVCVEGVCGVYLTCPNDK